MIPFRPQKKKENVSDFTTNGIIDVAFLKLSTIAANVESKQNIKGVKEFPHRWNILILNINVMCRVWCCKFSI